MRKNLPEYISDNYDVFNWKHAIAILKFDFPEEWHEVVLLLKNLKLYKSWINERGGGKSIITKKIDSFLYDLKWQEKSFDLSRNLNPIKKSLLTHKTDCYKNRVVLEIEWNNKDTFFDRDLNTFRQLFDLDLISVGIIITRSDKLQSIFKDLGRKASFGQSTTHLSKLITKIECSGSGGCPVIAFGITPEIYDERL